MGIKNLMAFLAQNAPTSIKETSFSALMGRKIAIDASMSLYQFLIAIQSDSYGGTLTNADGEVTAHIAGILSRVVRFLENGIKPVYVFDGKAPELKSGELLKRSERRKQAEAQLKEAIEAGNEEDIKKFQTRTIRVTQKQNEDVKELLRLLGVPVVQAKHDAESQCAWMAAKGMVYGVGTEDLDALTFGAPIMLRHLNFNEMKAKTHPILELNLDHVLKGLELTKEQFVEFCILCGCDFTDTIRGIGSQTAYRLMKQHGSMEKILENLDPEKFPTPENFDWKAAKEYFLNAPVDEDVALDLGKVDEEGLKTFLIDKHGFSEKRVENVLEKIKKSESKTKQSRLESFFGPVKVTINEKKLAEEKAKKDAEKAAKAKIASEKRKAAAELAALHKKALTAAGVEPKPKAAPKAKAVPKAKAAAKKEEALKREEEAEVKDEIDQKIASAPPAAIFTKRVKTIDSDSESYAEDDDDFLI